MNKSEWHEQVDFSELFFKSTWNCREMQSVDNLMGWKLALEAKISLVMGILQDDEKKEVYEALSQINKFWAKFFNEEKKIGKKLGSLHPVTSEFRSTLFLIESQIDTQVNGKMSFLNIMKKVDIGNL
tara:strand:+ start:523 stop:903 length:381 start_codon:yes stop_codon:yes gene_type:complete